MCFCNIDLLYQYRFIVIQYAKLPNLIVLTRAVHHVFH